jgi:predicted aconitase
MILELTEDDRALLSGAAGAAAASAMKILVAFAEATGASSFLDVTQAHVDGCLYHGRVSLDFVQRLIDQGGRVRVPTTLNVGAVDLIHPELMRMTEETRRPAAELMRAHLSLGCLPTFTCAPYQTLSRPAFGEHLAWGESNAIVFANSVIGARTERYGDFLDLCCAMTGRAPAAGLHLDENRRGEISFRLTGFGDSPQATDSLYVAMGLILGARSGGRVPVIEGLPPPRDEDQLKALGAAAASSGAVGLFHVVGATPEAATLAHALGGRAASETITVTPTDVSDALHRLSGAPEGTPLTAICLGTPHFSRREWERLLSLLQANPDGGATPIYVNTGRATFRDLEAEGLLSDLPGWKIIPIVDTCTYLTAILEELDGVVMTNSGKWAHYAPGNIGVRVAFGELDDCVASARAGRLVRRRR